MKNKNKALIINLGRSDARVIESVLSEFHYSFVEKSLSEPIPDIHLYSIFLIGFEPSIEFSLRFQEILLKSDNPVVLVIKDELFKGKGIRYPKGIEVLFSPIKKETIRSILLKLESLEVPVYRILVYEPEPYWAELLKNYFEEKNCEIQISGEGKTFKEALLGRDFDIIIMDITSEEELSLIESARILSPLIPCLVILPKDERIANLSLLSGANHYIFKPIRLDGLSPAINKTLAEFRRGSINHFFLETLRLANLSLAKKSEKLIKAKEYAHKVKINSLSKGSFQARLRSGSQLARTLLAIIHDSSNILTSIMGRAELLSYAFTPAASNKILVEFEKLKESLSRLNSLLALFQSFLSRQITETPGFFDPSEILTNVIETLQRKKSPAWTQKVASLDFKWGKHSNLFGVAQEFKITMEAFLGFIYENIPPETNLSLCGKTRAGKITIELEITGKNINREKFQKILQPDYTGTLKGEKLGIIQTFGFVQKYGGDYIAKITKKGVKITLHFPLVTEEEIVLPDHSILILASPLTLREYFELFLLAEGFRVQGVSSIDEACELLKSNIFSLFLYFTDAEKIERKTLLKLQNIRKKTFVAIIGPMLKSRPEVADLFIPDILTQTQLSALLRTFLYSSLTKKNI